MTTRALAAPLLTCLAGACADSTSKAPRTPLHAPAFLSPAELVPAEIDVVFRADVARLRATVGVAQMQRLLPTPSSEGSGAGGVLGAALRLEGDSVLIGFRGDPFGAGRDDTIVIVEGDLRLWKRSIDPPSGPKAWRLSSAPAPGVFIYDRTEPAGRGEPVRVALLRNRVAIAATAALSDAVSRVLNDGPDGSRLEPPSDGLVGAALRPRAFGAALSAEYPDLARLAGEATSLRASGDLDTFGVRADVEIAFRGESSTDRAERVLRAAVNELRGVGTRISAIARGADVRRDGALTVKLMLRATGDDARKITGLEMAAPARPATLREPQ